MAHDFCSIRTRRGNISLTRFWGGKGYGLSVQVTFDGAYTRDFMGGYVSLTVDEARVLHDQLNRFLEGDTDDNSAMVEVDNTETVVTERKP